MFHFICFSYAKKSQYGKSIKPKFYKAQNQMESNPRKYGRNFPMTLPVDHVEVSLTESHQRPQIQTKRYHDKKYSPITVANNYTGGDPHAALRYSQTTQQQTQQQTKQQQTKGISAEESRVIQQKLWAEQQRILRQQQMPPEWQCSGVLAQTNPLCKDPFYWSHGSLSQDWYQKYT